MLSEGINQKSEAHTENRQEDLSRGVLFTALTSRPCYIHITVLCNQTIASSQGAETETHTHIALLSQWFKKKTSIVFALHYYSEDTMYQLCNDYGLCGDDLLSLSYTIFKTIFTIWVTATVLSLSISSNSNIFTREHVPVWPFPSVIEWNTSLKDKSNLVPVVH